MKKVLVVSSNLTGYGHKSIADALSEEFINRGIKCNIIEGFSFAGNFGEDVGKFYSSILKMNSAFLSVSWSIFWKLFWKLSCIFPKQICKVVELLIGNRFLKMVKEFNPDIIVSVHAVFNGAVLNILKKHDLHIPFGVVIADLISINSLWVDNRADFIVCPTTEAVDICVQNYKASPEIVKFLGLPVRAKFCNQINVNRYSSFESGIRFIVMSGGEGVGNMTDVGNMLLSNYYNSHVTMITGRNTKLKDVLDKEFLPKYSNRVSILGFTEDIHKIMANADILLTRAGPNSIMEAVMCNVPFIVTGAIPGQEEGTPDYILKYNLGEVCNDSGKLKRKIDELIENDAQKLKDIKASQEKYRNPKVTKQTVDFLLNI